MTSQRFSNKQSKRFDFVSSLKGLIVPSVAFALTMIFNIYGVIDSMLCNTNNGTFTELVQHRTNINALFCEDLLGFDSGLMVFLFCFVGFLFALGSFYPFMSKRSTNFYFSNPLTRRDLFKNRILSSVLLMSGILFVGVLVITIINLVVSVYSLLVLAVAVSYYFCALIYMLVSFSIFTFGFTLAYTLIEGIVFGTCLYLFPTGIVFVLDTFYHQLLNSYNRKLFFDEFMFGGTSAFENIALFKETSILNPIILATDIKTHNLGDNIISSSAFLGTTKMFNVTMYIPLLIWAVISALFIVAAKHFFINRKIENVGLHASNKILNMFVATEFGLGMATITVSLYDFETIKKVAVLAITIVVFIISLIAFYVISTRKIKMNKASKVFVVGATAVFVIFVTVVSTGGLGYDNYVPSVDNVEMIAIADENVTADGSVSLSDYNMLVSLQYDFAGTAILTEKDDIEKTINIVSKITGDKDKNVKSNVSIIYQLKNGKRVYRNYKYLSSDSKKEFLKITDTKAYKEAQYDFLTTNMDSNFSKVAEKYGFSDSEFFATNFSYLSYYDDYSVRSFNIKNLKAFVSKVGSEKIEIKNTPELRKAIAEDYKATTSDKIYFSTVQPVCYVGFAEVDDEYVNKDVLEMNSINLSGYYIYPSMKNTLSYLETLGVLNSIAEFDSYKKINAVYTMNIKDAMEKEGMYMSERVFVGGTLVTYIEDEKMFDNAKKYTDEKEIREILENSIPMKHETYSDTLVIVDVVPQYGIDSTIAYVPLIMLNN